jgi:hypothetical protein
MFKNEYMNKLKGSTRNIEIGDGGILLFYPSKLEVYGDILLTWRRVYKVR